MSWELVENPAYAGKTPTPLEAACHDRTPFITVHCECGSDLHLHESQIAGMPADAEVATGCHGCSELLVFPPGYFQGAFQRLRDEGWIAA